jgi:hypothetical protein
MKWWPGPLLIVPILIIGILVYGFNKFMVFLTKVPISIDCHPSSSTIVMPADGLIYELLLFPLPAASGGGGLGKVFGGGGKEMHLTSTLQLLYQCQVINHGSIPLFNVEMAVHQEFKAVIHDRTNTNQTTSGATTLVREWPITIPMIDVVANGMFVFYILNSSEQFAFVTLPQFVTFQRANGDARDTAPLIQPPKFMMYFSPAVYL